MSNDSVQKTLIVATVLCIVCSIIVAGSTVLLRPTQEANKLLDFKKNIVLSAGLIDNDTADEKTIESAYKKVETITVNLNTGEVVPNIENFSVTKELQQEGRFIYIRSDEDKAKIKKRPIHAQVYIVKENAQITKYILPIHGKGLWSTMYGFLTLEPDLNTVSSINFYQDGETPGLGGEINNPRWKKLWPGKKVFGENLNPKLQVIKGHVDSNTKDKDHKVDGLSGATITSQGVSNMIQYWFGDHGFGQFIQNIKNSQGQLQENNAGEV